MRVGTTIAATLVLAVGALGLSACGETAGKDAVASGGTFEFYSPDGQTEIFYDEKDRKPLQDISGEALLDPSKTVNLDDFDGEVVVLNAWGSWCAPCRSESDDLQRVQDYFDEKAGSGTVLGINIRDNLSTAQDFVKDNGITYPSIYDPPFKLAARLGGVPAAVVPTTIVLDKQHRPAAVFLREITDKELLEVVEPLVAE